MINYKCLSVPLHIGEIGQTSLDYIYKMLNMNSNQNIK